jgi:hypothetical protein
MAGEGWRRGLGGLRGEGGSVCVWVWVFVCVEGGGGCAWLGDGGGVT